MSQVEEGEDGCREEDAVWLEGHDRFDGQVALWFESDDGEQQAVLRQLRQAVQ
jgi:hypothetical protein